MDVLYYLLEANLYLCLFYAFYHLFLKQETYYKLNRFYLLAAPAIGLILPLFSFENAVNLPVKAVQVLYPVVLPVHQNIEDTVASTVTYQQVFLYIYLLVALSFLIIFACSLLKIVSLYLKSKRFRSDGAVHVMITHEQDAFSFFNWLFYHPAIQPNEAIIAHELVHIRQRHSLDIIFFELLKAICWFNPLNHLIVRDVKLNHEYLADEEASSKGITKYEYARLLIDHAFQEPEYELTNTIFNGSQLENRINHLNRGRSGLISKFKFLGVIPLLAGLFLVSSFTINKTYGLIKFTKKGNAYQPVITARHTPDEIPVPESNNTLENPVSVPLKKRKAKPPVKNTKLYINATTDTVKIREIPTNEKPSAFPGIYAIGDKTYTEKELRSILKSSGKHDILFETRPMVGVYGENNAQAIEKWGAKASKGVIYVQPPKSDPPSVYDNIK